MLGAYEAARSGAGGGAVGCAAEHRDAADEEQPGPVRLRCQDDKRREEQAGGDEIERRPDEPAPGPAPGQRIPGQSPLRDRHDRVMGEENQQHSRRQ